MLEVFGTRPDPVVPSPVAPRQGVPKQPKPSRGAAESIVAGRWLLGAGALLVVLGVGFFLNLAFTNGWIGPSMRVAMGIIAGTALAVGVRRFRSSMSPLFVDAITALGGSIVYLSLYAAGNLFNLIPPIVTLIAMAIVTAGLFSLAYRDNRITLAHFALLGGILAPLISNFDWLGPIGFLVYFGTINVIAVSVCELRNWRSPQIVAVSLTWIFAPGSTTTAHHSYLIDLVPLLGTYLVFAIATSITWRDPERISRPQSVVLAINAGAFLLATSIILNEHRVALALAFLGIALAHIIVGRLLNRQYHLALAILAITFAIPPTLWSFQGLLPAQGILALMHLAWIGEGIVVAIFAARTANKMLGTLSLLVFVTIIGDLYIRYGDRFGPTPHYALILNERFLTLMALGAAIAYVRPLYSTIFASATNDGSRFAWMRIPVDLCFILGFLAEAHSFAVTIFPGNVGGAEAVAASIVLGAYGAGLTWYGLRRSNAVARWEGLILLAITALKVLFVDLIGFTAVVRIISAMAVGIALLAVAYLYQRQNSRTEGDS
ncbi:MAG: DUF2339 domain-containing protein [Vulcanimicrobiaceae bacterium]